MLIKNISRISKKIFHTGEVPLFPRVQNPEEASDIIFNTLSSENPCMIARYGATELMCIINYLGVKKGRPNLIRYLLGMEEDWWWRESSLKQIEQWSGFFPANIPNVEAFCELMLNDSQYVDILVSWLKEEYKLKDYLYAKSFIQGLFLDPFWSKKPWTRALQNKKVLVVHPFAESIEIQYKFNREHLFNDPNILPKFQLKTIKAIQSLGGINKEFDNWFTALDYMKKEIDKCDYDICLIGCGAYGFPLAAHVKRMNKKAIHMGGSLQLLFGIIGKRWEDPEYGYIELKKKGCYPQLINKYWIRPGMKEKPKNAIQVESGCYW